MPFQTSPFPDAYQIQDLLTDEQKLLITSVREFVNQEIEPTIAEHWEKETFPESIIPKLGEMGLLGSSLSGYGLPGMDHISYGLIMKELERCDSGLRSLASVQGALVMYPIHAYGSEEQKKKWLPLLGSGEKVGCFGLTESDGGSNPGDMKTTATETEDGWILNGSKMWITNGNISSIAIVWAQTSQGIRGFIVPCDSKGFEARRMKQKLSLRASITSELYFDNIKLPKDSILPLAEGLKAPLGCLTQARYGISWGVLGAAEACFDEAVAWSKERILFGEPLAHKQLIQAKLAKMLSKITQGQLLAHRLGQLKNQNNMHFAHVSVAKQNNCEIALEIARMSRDILGANGIMGEYKSMRHMCNLETVITYEGTNDVHLLIIGSEIGGKHAF
ncbi:MAG: acyl-CoA dehydrogenase family protein [Oligoflexales bacterium]